MSKPIVDVHKLFGTIGFDLWDVGRGCTAFGFELERHGDQILITDAEDGIHAPTDETTRFDVGHVDPESGEEFGFFESLDLKQAIAKVAELARHPLDVQALIADATKFVPCQTELQVTCVAAVYRAVTETVTAQSLAEACEVAQRASQAREAAEMTVTVGETYVSKITDRHGNTFDIPGSHRNRIDPIVHAAKHVVENRHTEHLDRHVEELEAKLGVFGLLDTSGPSPHADPQNQIDENSVGSFLPAS